MKKGYIETQITRNALERIIKSIGLILIIIFVGYLFLLSGHISTLIKPVTKINKISEIKEGMYVEFKSENIYDTGYDYKAYGKVRGIYGYVVLEDGYVLILIDNKNKDIVGSKKQNITGKITSIGNFEEQMRTNMINRLKAQYEQVTSFKLSDKELINQFANYKIVYGSSYWPSLIGGWLTIIIILGLLYQILVQILIITNYKNTKTIKIFGEQFSDIENNINEAHNKEKYIALNKRSIITDNYVAIFNNGQNLIKTNNDLIWLYQASTRGILPRKKSSGIQLNFIDKTRVLLPIGKKAKVEELLEEIKGTYPNKVYDYDISYISLYQNNPDNFTSKAGLLTKKKLKKKRK